MFQSLKGISDYYNVLGSSLWTDSPRFQSLKGISDYYNLVIKISSNIFTCRFNPWKGLATIITIFQANKNSLIYLFQSLKGISDYYNYLIWTEGNPIIITFQSLKGISDYYNLESCYPNRHPEIVSIPERD